MEERSHVRLHESSKYLTLMALRTSFMVTVGEVFGLQLQRAGFNSFVFNRSPVQALTVHSANCCCASKEGLNYVLSFNFWHLDFSRPVPAYISWGSVPKNRKPQTTYLSWVLKRHLQTFVLFFLMSLGFICNLSGSRRWNMPRIPFPGEVCWRVNQC